MKTFQPDYRHMVSAATNRKLVRMSIYEHILSLEIVGRVLGFDLRFPGPRDRFP